MGINYNLLFDQITPESINDYDVAVNLYDYSLESLFTRKTIQGKRYTFKQNEGQRVMASRYTPTNAPTDLLSRRPFAIHDAELSGTKVELAMDEDDLLNYSTPQTDIMFEEARQNIYDDAVLPRQSVREKRYYQLCQMLTTGGYNIDENGVILKLDMGIPKENKTSFTWSSSPNRLKDITDFTKLIANNSNKVRPTRILTTQKVIDDILLDEKIWPFLNAQNSSYMPTLVELNTWLNSRSLPQLIAYDRVINIPDESFTESTEVDAIPENTMIFLPSGTIGEVVSGTTPEEMNADSTVSIARNDDIVTQTFRKHDPEGYYVKASARFLTTLAVPKQVGIVTIK